jgi:hypothetical protein
MKNIYVIIAVLVVALIGLYFSLTINKNEVVNNTAVYSNGGLGIEFTYRTGPDGYVIQELAPSDTAEDLMGTIIIMRTEDAARNACGR